MGARQRRRRYVEAGCGSPPCSPGGGAPRAMAVALCSVNTASLAAPFPAPGDHKQCHLKAAVAHLASLGEPLLNASPGCHAAAGAFSACNQRPSRREEPYQRSSTPHPGAPQRGRRPQEGAAGTRRWRQQVRFFVRACSCLLPHVFALLLSHCQVTCQLVATSLQPPSLSRIGGSPRRRQARCPHLDPSIG